MVRRFVPRPIVASLMCLAALGAGSEGVAAGRGNETRAVAATRGRRAAEALPSGRFRTALLAELADLDGRSLLDPASLRPVVVCGDLNCSPWSPYFADLLERGRLTDPRAGGRTPTSWRSGNPLFALPIDHLLPGGSARVTGLAAGPDVGSDHRPLRATVTWAEP